MLFFFKLSITYTYNNITTKLVLFTRSCAIFHFIFIFFDKQTNYVNQAILKKICNTFYRNFQKTDRNYHFFQYINTRNFKVLI